MEEEVEGLKLGKTRFHNLIYCFPFNPQFVPLDFFELVVRNGILEMVSVSSKDDRAERWWGFIYNTFSSFGHKFHDTGENRLLITPATINCELGDFAKSIAFNLTKLDRDRIAEKYVKLVIETLYHLLFSSCNPQKSLKEVLNRPNREETEHFSQTFGCPIALFAPESDHAKNVFSPEEYTEYINSTIKDMFGDQVFQLKDGQFVSKARKISMDKTAIIEDLGKRLKRIKLHEEEEWARLQREAIMIARKFFPYENYSKEIEALEIHYEQTIFFPGEPDRSHNFAFWENSLKTLNDILETMKKELELDLSMNVVKAAVISNEIKEDESNVGQEPEKIIPDRLDSLRAELSKLRPEQNIDKNLQIAIRLVEKNEFLASSLITTRLIAYLISQIDVSVEIKEANDRLKTPLSYIDLIIKYFNERGIIPKGRKKDIPNLVKYGKDARDGVIHNIDNFPTATECLSQLGSCFLLLSLIGRLKMADFFEEIYLYLVVDACEDLYPLLREISPEQQGWVQQANLQFKKEQDGYWIGGYFTNHDFGAYSRLDWVSINGRRFQQELRDTVIREYISLVESNLGIKLSHEKVKNKIEKQFGEGSWQKDFGTHMDKVN